MFGALPIAYRLLGGLVLLAGVFLGGVFLGYRGPHNALVTLKSQVAQEAADQARAAQARDAENERVKKEITDDYQTQLRANTAYWTHRLLHTTGCASPMPQDPGAASGAHEAAANPLPDSYSQLVLDCQATTVQLEQLQQFEREKQ